jgi:hypothetical protein
MEIGSWSAFFILGLTQSTSMTKKWLTILLIGFASSQSMPLPIAKSTASAVAARLAPAGIPIHEITGQEYQQSCDEFVSAVSSAFALPIRIKRN